MKILVSQLFWSPRDQLTRKVPFSSFREIYYRFRPRSVTPFLKRWNLLIMKKAFRSVRPPPYFLRSLLRGKFYNWYIAKGLQGLLQGAKRRWSRGPFLLRRVLFASVFDDYMSFKYGTLLVATIANSDGYQFNLDENCSQSNSDYSA